MIAKTVGFVAAIALFSSSAFADDIWICKDKTSGQEQFTYNPVATETVECHQLKDEGSTFSRSNAQNGSGRVSKDRSSSDNSEGKKKKKSSSTKKKVKKPNTNNDTKRTGLNPKGASKKKNKKM